MCISMIVSRTFVAPYSSILKTRQRRLLHLRQRSQRNAIMPSHNGINLPVSKVLPRVHDCRKIIDQNYSSSRHTQIQGQLSVCFHVLKALDPDASKTECRFLLNSSLLRGSLSSNTRYSRAGYHFATHCSEVVPRAEEVGNATSVPRALTVSTSDCSGCARVT